MAAPGDVVIADFPGVQGTKRRPAVIVSSNLYHASRPDVILAILTTQTSSAVAATDYLLQDWASAGLHNASAFRAFLVTMPARTVTVIGKLSDRDWQQVQARLSLALVTK